jgi:hypothetical protein
MQKHVVDCYAILNYLFSSDPVAIPLTTQLPREDFIHLDSAYLIHQGGSESPSKAF